MKTRILIAILAITAFANAQSITEKQYIENPSLGVVTDTILGWNSSTQEVTKSFYRLDDVNTAAFKSPTTGLPAVTTTEDATREGRTGIGETNPEEQLHVGGNVKADSFIKSGGTSDDILLGDGSIASLSSVSNSGSTGNIAAHTNSVKLLIITGQSNAAGRGFDTDATSDQLAPQPNIKIWVAGIVNDWQDLDVGTNNQSTGTQHGVELGVAHRYAIDNPNETIYIVKHAIGGTDIDANSPGGSVYQTLHDDFLNPAIDNLLSNNLIPSVYFYFSQGEADSNSADYLLYAEKLSSLIGHYESKLGKRTQFIFPEILELGANTNESDINDIFNANHVLKDNVFTIQSKAYDANDLQHFSYLGLLDIADDIYDVMNTKTGALILNSVTNYEADLVNYLSGDFDYANATVFNFPEDALPTQTSSSEATAGTETDLRMFSPSDVRDMVITHSPSGGGGSDIVNSEIFAGDVVRWLATGGFTQIGQSGNPTFMGTGSNASPSFTSLNVDQTSARRNLSGLQAGVRDAVNPTLSFNYTFYWSADFYFDATSDKNVFCGLQEGVTDIGNVDASTLFNCVGIGKDDGDSELSFFHNDDTGTAQKITLGADFDVSNRLVVSLEMYYDGSDFYYRVNNLQLGTSNNWSTPITTNLPISDVGLGNKLQINQGTSGISSSFSLMNLAVQFSLK